MSASAKFERPKAWWRIVMWGLAALLLALPAIAMQFTSEVDWTASDFIAMAIMLTAAFGTFDLVSRMTGSITYRAAAALAVIASFLLVWVNLAVGIVGSEDNSSNLMFGVVLIVALAGSLIARFEPGAMARTMLVTSATQAIAGILALMVSMGAGGASWPLDVVFATLLFTGIWLGSAFLFRAAATS